MPMFAKWPLLLLLLIPVMMFPGAIPGERIVSADDHLSVHHAYQTSAGGEIRHPHLSDPALQFKALRRGVLKSLREGSPPLWNPLIWGGAPLLGDAQSMVGSPVTWIHWLLPSDLAQDAAVVWLMLWVGLGAALLASELGADSWGASTAGAAAMTAPYLSVWLLHPHAATFVWIPWLLLGLARRSPWLTALATAGLVAGGHPETAVHGGMMAALALVLRFRWKWAPLWMAVGAGLAAPIWMPFVEEVVRSATVHAHGGNTLAPAQLFDLIWPGIHGHPALESWENPAWSWADGRIHPGLGTLGLALLALRRGRERWLWGLWAGFVLLSVTGMPGPLNHARMAGMGGLMLAIGAGLAMPKRWKPAAFAAVVITGLWSGWHDQGTLDPERHDPTPAPWTDRLVERVGSDRVLGLGWALQPNTGALLGLKDVRGYDLPVSTDTERLQMMFNPRPIRPWFRVDTMPPLNVLRFSAVRVVLSPEPLDDPIDLGPAPLHATAIKGGLGRAWVARAPTPAADANSAARMVLTGEDSVSRPPVEGLIGSWPTTGAAQAVNLAVDQPTRVAFQVDLDEPGLAVLADAWHPGWQVSVNQRSVPPLRVGGVFRGVALEPGSNSVEWIFAPRTGTAAVFASLASFGLVFAAGMFAFWRPRRRQKDRGPAASTDAKPV